MLLGIRVHAGSGLRHVEVSLWPLYLLWAAESLHSCAVWAVDNCLKFLAQTAIIPRQLLQKLACLAPSYTSVKGRPSSVDGQHVALPQCLPGL